uniref:von Willebrand factor A domain-containing protein 8 n=1 Tax=Daphnia magna TaxID=35525 RepID=A0A0P6CK90_9CRUS
MYIKGLSSVCSYLPKYNSYKTCSSIRSNVCYREKISKRYISLTTQSLRNEETLEIGGVTRKLTKSERVELVPTRYDHLELDQSTLKKLRWMLQKDVLGQDMFLIGPPGPEKFRIAHLYAQLVNQEVEYIALSRDTTESDLKQRREIHSGSAHFEDQAAVRAAIHGRILILDGIEKTERNVLPVLNNLLENREMPLEDGRLLISSARYDKLRKASKSTDLENWKLVRVDEKFRVIALGIPVPKYRGHPLDPPLRSRFQALKIEQKSFKDQLLTLRQVAPGVPESSLIELASFAYAINASESEAQGLPDFPISSLPLAVALMENNPDLSVDNVLHRLYPYKSFLTKDGQSMIENLMKTFKIDNTTQHQLSIENNPTPSVQRGAQVRDYIATKYHQQVVHELKESIEIHDICLIGARGSGKSTLIRQLANLLSLEVEPIMLYQDMTSRDLLQQRSTLPNGDTVWTPSALLKAAIDGKLAVIDGLHRINTGTLFTLQSIIHEREAQLFDGSRILRHDRYDALQERLGCSKEIMAEKKLFKVHKNFRIIALAEPPNSTGKTSSHWLSPEVLSMFFFHTLRPMNMEEEVNILEALVGDKLALAMHPVLKLAQHVRQSNDPTLNSLAPSLSTRQLLRLAKRLKEYPNSDPWGLVERTCLSQFLPRLPQEALRRAMESCGIEKTAPFETSDSQLCCVVKNGVLTIGETKAKIYQQGNLAKIPDVVFHDTRQHLRVLEALLQDFILGDHLLLVGNQGVGKNRLIDRLLALMNRPREYIQLHRDTTVQSLTVQPTVFNGVVEFQDSPLVRAARDGSVLIVDEADKAPTQVTCILKTLIENGEMLLSDGRRILPMGVRSDIKETDIVRLHPDFRMIVLANRPGFPFLGNDFFAALGDVFSVHAIENPSLESELELLRHFGPSLSDKTLRSVVQAFSQLRSLADQGMLNYPYSTREVINVVKHLERYPKDGIVRTVSNVFDFDAYSPEAKELIIRVFHENGIPLGASVNNFSLAVQQPLAAPIFGGQWKILPSHAANAAKRPVGLSGAFSARGTSSLLVPTEARLLWFSEQKTNWKLPIGETQWIHGLVTSKENTVHILTTSPAVLYSLDLKTNRLLETQLDRFIDPGFYANQCRLQLSAMKDQILIFDPERCKLVMFDYINQTIGTCDLMPTPSVTNSSLGRLSQRWIGGKNTNNRMILAGGLPDLDILVFYEPQGTHVQLFNPNEADCTAYQMDFNIQSVFAVMNDKVIIQSQDSNQKFLFDVKNGLLQVIEESQTLGPVTSNIVSHSDSKALFTMKNYYGTHMTIPQNELLLWPGCACSDSTNIVLLPTNDSVVRIASGEEVPKPIDRKKNLYFLQVADLSGQTLRYIPIPNSEQRRRYGNSDKKTHLCAYNQGSVVTVDDSGFIRLWEINQSQITRSLEVWRSNVGDDVGQLTIKRTQQSGDVSGPKVGKIDPKNTPHVGGNTWAGGTGGRDTAGLGGRGGPYRLDAGHDVHQVSDEDKAAVPEEIQRAAREMGKKAYQERLKQIRMDPVDAELYQKFSSSTGAKSNFGQYTSKRQRATMDETSNLRRFRRYQDH